MTKSKFNKNQKGGISAAIVGDVVSSAYQPRRRTAGTRAAGGLSGKSNDIFSANHSRFGNMRDKLSSARARVGDLGSKVRSKMREFKGERNFEKFIPRKEAADFQERGQGIWNKFRWNSLSDTGASGAAYMTPTGTGFIATLLKGAGGFCNLVFKILSILENVLNKVFTLFARLEPLILKGSFVLYVWKILLLIALIIIAISDLFGGGLFSKEALQGIYSVCKGLNVIIIFIATLIGSAKVNKTIEEKKAASRQQQALKYPFPLLLVTYIISAAPVLYDLLALVALSSIVLAYYTIKCTGAKPNTWGIIDTISNLLLMVGGAGFILSFLQFRIKKSCGTSAKNSIDLQGPSILMLTSMSYFIVLLITLGFEQMVSDNVMYWLSKNGAEAPGTDCVEDNLDADEGFTSVLQLVLSIIITVFLVILIIIGVIPPVGPLTALATLNDRARTILQKAADGIFKLLI